MHVGAPGGLGGGRLPGAACRPPGERRAARRRRPRAPRRDRVPPARRRGRPRARDPAGPRGAHRPAPQGGGGDPRDRGVLGGVRPGPHLRQPLRVLLHLPAPQGDATQPVPEGRRLPAVVPLRELHHPHPLHRARPRAGPDRAAVAAVRVHPQHRPRAPGPDAAQSPGRHQPALAAGPARRGDRGARAGRGVPGGQRRRRPRDDAGGHRRRVLRPRHRGVRAPGGERLHHRAVHAAPHRRRGRGRRRPRRGVAAAVPGVHRPAPGVRGGRVLPPRRQAVPGRRGLRRLPPARERHRHGPRLRGRVPRRRRRRPRRAARVLLVGRRRAGGGIPRPARRRPAAPARRHRAASSRRHRRRATPGRHPHRRVRRRGARAAARRRAAARARRPRAQRLLRRQHRRHRLDDRGRHRPGAAGPTLGQRVLLPDVCLSEGRFLDGIDRGRPPPPGRGHRERRVLAAPGPARRGSERRTPTGLARGAPAPVAVALGASR